MNKLFKYNSKMVSFMRKRSWLFQSLFAVIFGVSIAMVELGSKGYDLLFPTWFHVLMMILLGYATIDFTIMNRKKLKEKGD